MEVYVYTQSFVSGPLEHGYTGEKKPKNYPQSEKELFKWMDFQVSIKNNIFDMQRYWYIKQGEAIKQNMQ